MPRRALALLLVCAAWILQGREVLAASHSRAPVTSSIKKLKMSPEEMRIRIRALIRPTLGKVEECADHIREEAKDPAVRREALRLKIEMTTTFLAAFLRDDPVLALADAWAYTIQVQARLEKPDVRAKLQDSPIATDALAEIQSEFRVFAAGLQEGFNIQGFEARLDAWAEKNPIEGELYVRPAVDTALASVLAQSSGTGGAMAALSQVGDTTTELMTRLDLYTMYVPRLARWEVELAIDEMTNGVGPQDVLAELERTSRAFDRIATVAERVEGLVPQERAIVLDAMRDEGLAVTRDLQAERRAVLEAVQQERVATLQEIEGIVQRLADRSSAPLGEAVRVQREKLMEDVESLRKRTIDDGVAALDRLVDKAFVRAIELLLIASALVAVGAVVYARFLRR